MIPVACLLAGLAFGYGWHANNGPILLIGVFVALLALWASERQSPRWHVANSPDYRLPSRANDRNAA